MYSRYAVLQPRIPHALPRPAVMQPVSQHLSGTGYLQTDNGFLSGAAVMQPDDQFLPGTAVMHYRVRISQ